MDLGLGLGCFGRGLRVWGQGLQFRVAGEGGSGRAEGLGLRLGSGFTG